MTQDVHNYKANPELKPCPFCGGTAHWVSVEDELPPRDEDHPAESIPVLVYNPTGKDKIYLDWYIYEDEDNIIGWYSCDEGITHWRLLPTPPVLSNSENTGMDLKGGEQ